MRQANFARTALLAMALVACQKPVNDTDIAIDNQVNAAETASAGAPPDEVVAVPEAAAPSATVIPAQYRGRWGMVAADCTSTRGDAKGLIDVSESGIKFFESRATLRQQRPAIATSFSALYGFTGEGQTWEKIVTLTRTGDTLKRADDEGSYTYDRCA